MLPGGAAQTSLASNHALLSTHGNAQFAHEGKDSPWSKPGTKGQSIHNKDLEIRDKKKNGIDFIGFIHVICTSGETE